MNSNLNIDYASSQVSNSSFVKMRDVMGDGGRAIMHYSPSQFSADSFFSQRSLLLADQNRGDKVIGKIDPSYLQFLREVGVNVPQDSNIIQIQPQQSIRKQLQQTPFLGLQKLQASFYDEVDPSKVITTQGLSREGVLQKGSQEALENKISFRNFALNNELPYVCGGEIFSKREADEADLERIIQTVGDETGVVIRATTGAGVNFVLENVENTNERRAVIDDMMRKRGADKEAFLVEPRLELVSNPNRTAYITPQGDIVPLSVSEQLVDENLKFTGSVFDRTQIPELTPYLEVIGNKLFEDGYQGVFGVDLMRDVNSDSYMVEANVRVNASNYSTEIINRMEEILNNPISRAYAETLDISDTSITNFTKLRRSLEGVLFDGTNQQGVMPISPNALLKKGKVQLITYGESSDDIELVRNETHRMLQLH